MAKDVLHSIKGGLVVSCQAEEGSPYLPLSSTRKSSDLRACTNLSRWPRRPPSTSRIRGLSLTVMMATPRLFCLMESLRRPFSFFGSFISTV